MTSESGPRLLALGSLDLRLGPASLPLGPHKQRALLGLLALHEGRVVPMDTIIDGMWGERSPSTAAAAVQVYVAGARKVLAAAGLTDALQTAAPGYRLVLAPDAFDVTCFERIARDVGEASRVGRDEACLTGCEQALRLWRGEPLADCPEPFATAPRRRLEELRRGLAGRRLELLLAAGESAVVAAESQAALVTDPYDESLWRLLATALYRGGRQADALDTFRRARAVLVDDLGIDPGHDLVDLERRVRAQDPALSAHPIAARTAADPVAAGVRVPRRVGRLPRPGLVTPDGAHIPLWRRELTIGRHRDCDLVLDHRDVSRRHARVRLLDGSCLVVDLGSTNGTWINGRRVPPGGSEVALRIGDRIEIGVFALRFDRIDPTQPDPASTMRADVGRVHAPPGAAGPGSQA